MENSLVCKIAKEVPNELIGRGPIKEARKRGVLLRMAKLLVLSKSSLAGFLCVKTTRSSDSLSRVVDVVGFEPTTSWLQTKHSSN